MNPRTPLGQLQIRRLGELAELGLCTDESLSAHLLELGQPCSPGTIGRYRQGIRAAPLALLDLLLSHLDQEGRIAVLELWARPNGLQVIPAELGPQQRQTLRLLRGDLQRAAEQLAELTEPRARKAA